MNLEKEQYLELTGASEGAVAILTSKHLQRFLELSDAAQDLIKETAGICTLRKMPFVEQERPESSHEACVALPACPAHTR